MKLWTRWMLTALLAVGVAMVATGCGSDDDDDSSSADAATSSTGSTGSTGSSDADADAVAEEAVVEADEAVVASVDIAGVWSGTRSSSGGSTSMQFSFNQSGDALQGAYQDSSGNSGNLTGTITGDDIALMLSMAGGDVWTFSGAANATGTSMNGTMTSPGGNSTVQVTK